MEDVLKIILERFKKMNLDNYSFGLKDVIVSKDISDFKLENSKLSIPYDLFMDIVSTLSIDNKDLIEKVISNKNNISLEEIDNLIKEFEKVDKNDEKDIVKDIGSHFNDISIITRENDPHVIIVYKDDNNKSHALESYDKDSVYKIYNELKVKNLGNNITSEDFINALLVHKGEINLKMKSNDTFSHKTEEEALNLGSLSGVIDSKNMKNVAYNAEYGIAVDGDKVISIDGTGNTRNVKEANMGVSIDNTQNETINNTINNNQNISSNSAHDILIKMVKRESITDEERIAINEYLAKTDSKKGYVITHEQAEMLILKVENNQSLSNDEMIDLIAYYNTYGYENPKTYGKKPNNNNNNNNNNKSGEKPNGYVNIILAIIITLVVSFIGINISLLLIR